MTVIILTIFTLCAFAANSLLCRTALGGSLIDPFSFTTIRLVSGAFILAAISHLVPGSAEEPVERGSWGSGLALFVYAAMFSSAYLFLDTGIGALILFAAVQATMIISGLRSGERPAPVQWLGFVAAMGGLIYLVWPGIAAPSPGGAVLMMLSGIAWGIYSIRGKGVITPVASTAGNFLRAAPLAAMVSVVTFSLLHLETTGIVLALVSGMLTSGLGYVLWYKVLGSLSTTQAAIVQLLVPVLAAFGGVAFLAEPLSLRLAISSVLILGGVVLAVWKRREKAV